MEQLDVIGLLKALQLLERNASVSLMYSGLRIPQFRLLSLLEEGEDATVTQLSKMLGITRASTSVMVNELINAGMLMVMDNERDRRSFHVRLSDYGRNKLNVGRKDLAVLTKELSQNLSQEIVVALNSFAGRMGRAGRHAAGK